MQRDVLTFREDRDAVQCNLRTGRSHVENTVQLLLTCWELIADGIARELAKEVWVCHKTVLHILHEILGYPQTCSVLDTPWNFRGATMAPLCSLTGFIGPVPKGRWRLSWTKSVLDHTNQTWNAKQMNGSIQVHLVQSAPYTPTKVMVIVAYHTDWVILHQAVPARQTLNDAYYSTFLQHHLRPALRWWRIEVGRL